jgi:glycosyltransferase involved in cell wall biosynthesis
MRLYEGLDALVLRFAKRIVAVSQDVKSDLIAKRVPPAIIRIVENGIDLDRFNDAGSTEALRAAFGVHEHDVVTIAGRLSPEKGHQTFLQAVKRFSLIRDNVKFLVVGDGPLKEELWAESVRLNLDDRVVFVGFRSDMPDVYALTDVLVNASSIEGLPMTILEAMASKVPVIATRAGGIPNIITHDVTGLLVDPHDVDALEAAIASLVQDDHKRRRIAAAAFAFVSVGHSCEGMCDAYKRVYHEVLHGN